MSKLLILSTMLITLALLFYSVGIWSERLARYLKPWHLAAFWLGFLFDMSGTYAMHLMSKNAFDFTNVHTLTGQIAIWLMFAHAVWASWVIIKGSENLKVGFHKYSLFVWMVWLVPYFGGMIVGMSH